MSRVRRIRALSLCTRGALDAWPRGRSTAALDGQELVPASRILISLLVFCAAVARADDCEEVPSVATSFDVALVRPGTYKLILVATSGRNQGASAEGELSLRPTSASDRSPRTGQVAQDENLAEVPFYGWAELDFLAVGASVGNASAGDPAPNSRDPVFPGVLVRLVSWMQGYPRDTPVLLISTVSNRRDDVLATDGGGIGLWVRRLGETSFAGEWSRWGIVISGSGYFCATLAEP